uniref:Uncharacterized protein n=1 Tax=Sphaerodactylus townsendi TaxID=933632 RepID=A0ACB8EQS2_9SAUR
MIPSGRMWLLLLFQKSAASQSTENWWAKAVRINLSIGEPFSEKNSTQTSLTYSVNNRCQLSPCSTPDLHRLYHQGCFHKVVFTNQLDHWFQLEQVKRGDVLIFQIGLPGTSWQSTG